jgi:hypothetical protein
MTKLISLRTPAAARAADEHKLVEVRDHRGRHIGSIRHSSLPVAARIAGHHSLKQQADGSWQAFAPVTAQASSRAEQDEVHAASLRAAKGSVSSHPDKPEKRTRPRR